MTNDTLDLSSSRSYFDSSASSTWESSSESFSYSYENATTNGTEEGSDTLVVGGLNLTSVTIGLADYNQDLFESGLF